jgi:type I restriction enzyme S subunit
MRETVVALGDVLELATEEVPVRPSVLYNIAGVYSFGRGLFRRTAIRGSDTKYKSLVRLHKGHLVISRLKAWEGAVALIPTAFDGTYASPEFPSFRPDTSRVLPEYLDWLCRWPRFWRILLGRSKGIGARRERVSADRFLAASVPLPTLERQRQICVQLTEVHARLREAAERLTRLDARVDSIWWALLNRTVERLAAQYGTHPLGERLQLNPESVQPARDFGSATFAYIDIGSVGNDGGDIVSAKRYIGLDAPSRARRRIRSGDLLLSTVRPNLRGFAIVTPDYDGQVCSTGFAVLRGDGALIPSFLRLVALSGFFVDQLTLGMRGGHYPAVNDRVLRNAAIVSPPLGEQRRLVASLEASERVCRHIRTHNLALKHRIDALGVAMLERELGAADLLGAA